MSPGTGRPASAASAVAIASSSRTRAPAPIRRSDAGDRASGGRQVDQAADLEPGGLVERREAFGATGRAEAGAEQLGDRAVGDGALARVAASREDDAAAARIAARDGLASLVLPIPASPSTRTSRPIGVEARHAASIGASSVRARPAAAGAGRRLDRWLAAPAGLASLRRGVERGPASTRPSRIAS